ncbi:hypothetical protein BsWGS_16454 [Bradybaena similaris]
MKGSYETMASSLHIVMLAGIMGIGQTMGQVCPYTDPKCECNRDWLTCYDLQQIPPVNRGASVSHYKYLSFEKGDINSIAKNSLPSGLTEFSSSRHPLTNISDDAFDNLADTLERVDISGAKFNTLPTALKGLTKLTYLVLVDTPIQVWDAGTLRHIAATLESIELLNVGLSAWPSWISDFHLLRTIHFSSNSLESIPGDAFNSFKDSLTNLQLTSAGLTQIPQALSTLTSLTSLDLSGNNFTDVSEVERITESPFAQKLSYLYLNAVEFRKIANFSSLTSLRSISLEINRISDIPAGSLPLSLPILYISTNILSSVPKDVASMSGLEALYMHHNLISEIEPIAFPSSLTHLELSANNLTIIENTAFKNLNVLRTLRLDNNPISIISPAAFSDLVSLETLSIIETHLTAIPLAFTRLSSKTDITFSTTQPLSCTCPAPNDLVQWHNSVSMTMSLMMVECSNGQLVHTYLSGQCGQTTVSP